MALNAPDTGRVSQFENTVVDFVKNQRGCFITLTQDQAFLSILRKVLTKDLALGGADMLIPVLEDAKVSKTIAQAEKLNMYPFLFIERYFNGQDTTPIIKQLGELFPKLFIVVLTVEIAKHRVMYLHELGVDNFIAKPVSAATIIEKLAFTIKPQSKLGELIDEAKSHLEAGEPARAKALAAEILGLKPGSAAGLMVLGDAEYAMNNTAGAREAYLEASRNADLYLEPLRKLADLSEGMGDLEGALGYLEKLDGMSPLNSERKIDMGEINLELGYDERAQYFFDAAITQVSNTAMEHIAELAERVAKIYENRDPVRAEMYFRKALDAKTKNLTREDMRLFNHLGVSLRKQGKWQDAIMEYKRALQIDPKDSSIHYNMGMAYVEGESLMDALHSMEKAVALNPDLALTSSGVAYNMGLVFMKNNRQDVARQCFEAALSQDPGLDAARKALKKLQPPQRERGR